MFKKPYKTVFAPNLTNYTPKHKNALKGEIKGLTDFYIIYKDILRERRKIMPVNYKSQQFFKGKDRQYDRFELRRIWCEIPQRDRNIDMIFNLTGIPKYHLKELAKVDEWETEAQKEDEFKMLAKKNETEMMSEENRRQYLEAKYEEDKKLFNVAHNILNSGELEQKIIAAFKDSETPRDLDIMLKILHKIEDRYSETIGLGKPDKVNLTQNNYYNLRSAVRDEIYAGEIVEVDAE